jgi:hypothetical protein
MRTRSAIAALVLLAGLLFCAHPAHADSDPIVEKVNALPEVCDPVFSAIHIMPQYLTHDPDADTEPPVNNGSSGGTWDILPLERVGKYVQRVNWGNSPLPWNIYTQDDPKRYDDLMSGGDQYNSSYVVYRAAVDLYSPQEFVWMYKLLPLSRMSSTKMPEVFTADRSDELGEILKKLGPSDLVEYGANAYPVVRKPGHVALYEIDPDRLDVPYEQKHFKYKLVCDIWLKSVYDKAMAPPPPPPPPPSEASVMDAIPKTFPACDAYAGDHQAYSSCNDRLEKLARLKAAAKLRDESYSNGK